MTKEKFWMGCKDYVILTMAAILLNVGVYVFKFPNHFCFGGVTGISVVLSAVWSGSASVYNLWINVALLGLGFLFLGGKFGIKTVYVSLLSSFGLELMERFWPMSAPLTSEPVLEMIFAVVLPAASAAILFNVGASGGGTDIVAMILKKYTSIDIGMALFLVDLFITVAACLVFDVQTGLFSFTGLMAKSLVVDNVLESINLCKYFNVVCDNPEPICHFIVEELGRSATVYTAEGAFSKQKKTVVLTVMKRRQAVQLRNFIRKTEPTAFILISNTSEIIGKGFRGFN